MRSLDRRNFVILGAAGACFATPAGAECRRPENPSVTSCSRSCSGLWSTYDCQIGVVFPSQNRIVRGAVAGAVLGGVIAFASGDVSILQGVLIGGVVGGLAASVQSYTGYRLARAGGSPRNAFREMEYDKEGDEDRLNRVVLADVAADVFQRTDEMAREAGAVGSLDEITPLQRPPSMFQEFIRETLPLVRQIAQGQTGSVSTRDVSQTALRQVGIQFGSSPPPPRRDVVERDSLVDDVARGAMASMRLLARRTNADHLLSERG